MSAQGRRPSRVFLDYDDTLVNLIDPWLDWVDRTHGVRLRAADIPRFSHLERAVGKQANDFWRAPGVYAGIRPLPGAAAFVDALLRAVGERNVLVVSVCADGAREEKAAHAERHFGLDPARFISARSKFEHTGGGILVDDHPGNVVLHALHNRLPGVVFDRAGLYGWSKIENYGRDPEERRAWEKTGPGLVSFCYDYPSTLRRILALAEAA